MQSLQCGDKFTGCRDDCWPLTMIACTTYATVLLITSFFLQGHFQIFLSKNNPLFKKGLQWYMRLMYCTSVYTYLVSVLATLTLSAIPLINLWLGWFPLVITTSFIISFTLYFMAGILLKYGPVIGGQVTIQGIWFASCANTLFCPTYLWAFIFALPGKVHFKVSNMLLCRFHVIIDGCAKDRAAPGRDNCICSSMLTVQVALPNAVFIAGDTAWAVCWNRMESHKGGFQHIFQRLVA